VTITHPPDQIHDDYPDYDADAQLDADLRAEMHAAAQPQADDGQRLRRASWRGRNRPGGGWNAVVEPATEFRGSSYQVCGVWPWSWAGSTITAGVPLGRHLMTKATICCDPIHWFAAKLITNPSVFIIANTGVGKSTMVRHMITGMAGCGIIPVVLGDIRPDYRSTVQALEGGQVVEIGRGRGAINPLDLGELGRYADEMDALAAQATDDPQREEELTAAAHRLRMEAHARSKNLTRALVELKRKGVMGDAEDEVLSRAIEELAGEFADKDHAPLLEDLDRKLDNPSPYLMNAVLARGDREQYHARVDALQTTVRALCGSDWGPVFNRQTTERLRMDATAIDVDISSLKSLDAELEAAVLLATWAEGYGAIEAANTVADLGLGPQRRFFIVLDELWKIVRTSMVDKIDQLTRLNRADAAGQAMITHSLDDLESPAAAADRAKARGFINRAGMVIIGGLPLAELQGSDGKDGLKKVVYLSQKEIDLVASWEDGGSLSGRRKTRRGDKPPGAGKFLIKVGNKPGLPVEVITTPAENDLLIHDTNNRWTDPQPVVDLTEPAPPLIPDTDPVEPPPTPVTTRRTTFARAAASAGVLEVELSPTDATATDSAADVDATDGPSPVSLSTSQQADTQEAPPQTAADDFDPHTADTQPIAVVLTPAPPADALSIITEQSDADPFSAYSTTDEGDDEDMATYTRYTPGQRPTVTNGEPPAAPPKQPRVKPSRPARKPGGGKTWLLAPILGGALVLLFLIVAIGQLGGGDTATDTTSAANGSNDQMTAISFQGAAFPVSSANGPGTVNDTTVSGFAHTETGAALAAAHLAARTDPHTGPAVFTPVITNQATGPTADVLAARQAEYAAMAKVANVVAPAPIIEPTNAFVGYRIDSWTLDGPVTVRLLMQSPAGNVGEAAPTVVWDPAVNDYKLVLAPGGAIPGGKIDPATASQYTRFLP
jgi:hypothetical protein